MYCHRCRTKIEGNVNFCPNCGARLELVEENSVVNENSNNQDNIPVNENSNAKPWSTWAYILLIILSILAPLIGLIVGFYNRKNKAKESQAKNLIYISVIFWILYIIIQVLAR